MERRTFSKGFVAGAALAATGLARAQAGRQPTMVVPYTPGGSTDILGRLFADAFSAQAGEKYILENRPGANGMLGSAYVAAAPPDGRTLMYTYGNLMLNQEFLMKENRLQPLRDLVPVTRACLIQAVIVAAPSFPASNLRQLLDMARKSPGKHSYAYYGDLGIAAVAAEADVQLLRVPYKGGVPGMIDVAAGTVDIITSSLAQAAPLLKAGKLKALAVYGDERLREWPDVPTVKEALPNFRAVDYQVVMAPKGTSGAVLAQLSQRARAALAGAEIRQAFLERGAIVAPLSPEETLAFMETDREQLAKVVKAAKILPE
ncbi:tripartite tricarboxylate transporter substrate binding protein [Ottowia thiooxydans]|uniref:tripartite tricarboxylate transporter substrate binding protein n=1 Tax=Ottowia thiooxydans TaxID=219182 RepID=UPI0004293950|nr:tripartite tricarboxylate transporter substrate binding protein [Ottowia thiooxydans]